jgi:Ca2+-binding RTX toxin-like protein
MTRALALCLFALLLVLPATATAKTLVGTPGKDRLVGGDRGNVINGDGGGDYIAGGAGADRL